MSEFSDLVLKYEAQGFASWEARSRAKRYMYHHRRYGQQKAILNAIELMKVSDPKKYAELMYEATHAEEIEALRQEKARKVREEFARHEELRLCKFKHSLVVAGVPDIDFSGVGGMIAFRTWHVKGLTDTKTGEGSLFLGSTAMDTVWKSVMIADRIPADGNDNGLYCVRLDPLGLMTKAASYFGKVCGLLELRGKVLEHTDGIVRAEWARIVCVLIQAGEETEVVYSGLLKTYPTVPMYVLHKEQIAEVLLRVTVMQSMREAREE